MISITVSRMPPVAMGEGTILPGIPQVRGFAPLGHPEISAEGSIAFAEKFSPIELVKPKRSKKKIPKKIFL